MLNFIDINTGNVFNGDSPYIHWFDGEQSTDLFYIKKLCFITDEGDGTMEVEIENNDVFHLLDTSTIVDNNSYNIDELYAIDNKIVLSGDLYETDKVRGHIYIAYILGKATTPGEYIASLKIGQKVYRIGADFYGENEELYIGLMNRGVEIPREIQKAIYSSNVHEDYYDNILLNRKWKELLSNFWDVMDNRGSYKSLLNSLKWFEYGDNINLYEVWRRYEGKKEWFGVHEIQDVMSNKYRMTKSNFMKTTYIALSLALNKATKEMDDDGNPVLEEISYKWSNEDMALKLCLLNKFYQTYFMPIHLDLFYSTIEKIVYTNTFKVLTAPLFSRKDVQYYTDAISCNVKNGDSFKLGNVSCQVGPDTVFGTQYKGETNYEEIKIIGVDKVVNNISSDNDAKTFYSQLYNGVGCIVPFELTIPLVEGDKIKRSVIFINNEENNDWNSNVDLHEYGADFKFNLFCKYEKTYEVRLQFDTLLGHNFVKRIVFDVVDTDGLKLEIYKFTKKTDISSIENPADAFKAPNDWIFSRQPLDDKKDNQFHTQYLPTTPNMLSHMLVIEGEWDNPDSNYICGTLKKGETTYTVAVCKNFGEKLLTIPTNTYRNVMVFCPGFYDISILDEGKAYNSNWNLDQFTVKKNEILCIKPSFKFAHKIEKSEWEFVNVSLVNPKTYTLPSTNEPYVAPTNQEEMESGFYDVIFRYKLGNETNEIRLNSAFYRE